MRRWGAYFAGFAGLFIPAALVVGVGLFAYGHAEIARQTEREQLIEANEVTLVDSALDQSLNGFAADIHFLSTLPRFKQTLDDPSTVNTDALAANFMAFMNAFGIYDKIRWIDESGKERVRVNFDRGSEKATVVPASLLQDKSSRYFFKEAENVPASAVYLSPFDLNVEGNSVSLPIKPTLRVAVPAIDSKGVRHGILIVNYNGRQLLEAIVRASDRIGGRITLVNHDGYWLHGQRPEDEWGFALGRADATLARRNPEVWHDIRATDTGHMVLADGLWTWRRVHPLKEVQQGAHHAGLGLVAEHNKDVVGGQDYVWTLVTRMPKEQLTKMASGVWLRLLWPALFLLGLVAVGSGLLARSRHQIQSLNADLSQRAADAEAANRAKASFLANMSHEIRTPMNAVLGFAYLLQQRGLDSEAMTLVGKIRAAGQSLLTIINDILDFSKIEAGRLEVEQVAFRLGDVLDSVAAIMTAFASSNDIELVVAAPPPGAEFLIGDPQRLQQVLINLTGNAIKFTEQGEVALQISQASSGKDMVALRFAVRDTGIGIPLEKQAEIFSAFSQADMATTRRFGGTGLGLAISRHLVQIMGGELGVVSTPGKGSEFWFVLPMGIARPDGYAVPSMALQNLLIADDNPTARDTLASIARSLGWAAECVETGDAAVEQVVARALKEEPFDVVLIDWRMPGMDGLAASKAIRASVAGRHLPIIVMVTAYARDDLLREVDVTVADVVLNKPVTASSLYNAVAEAKRRRGMAEGRGGASEQTRRIQRLPGVRLLVVDDSDINREVARRILESEGALVHLASNGEEAVRALADAPDWPQAVLMDIQMPVMDGYEATRQIRDRVGISALPVVALTAGAFKSEKETALAAGMNDFIAKPFDVDDMVATLRHLTGCTRTVETHDGMPAPPSEPVHGGIDFAEGLRRWGDAVTYRRYLKRFADSYAGSAEQLGELFARDNHEEAASVAHKLKGTAGNLALIDVARLAGLLDSAAKESGSPGDLTSKLQDALDAALAAIRDFCAGADGDVTSASAMDMSAAVPLLQGLIVALDADNPDAAAPLMIALSKTLPKEWLMPIQERIDAFDFRAAEEQCRIVLTRLNASFEDNKP